MSSAVQPHALSLHAASSPGSLITSTGIGSGLDIGGIVSVADHRAGAAQNNQLSDRKTTLNAQVSAYGTFKSALSTRCRRP